MSATTHPSAALLADYATGDMVAAVGLVLSAHLEACADCRRQVSALENAEGDRLEGAPPAPLAAEALERALAAIEADPSQPQELARPVTVVGDVQLPFAAARVGFKARRFLGQGLWAARARLSGKDGWRAFLLHIPAGTTVPTHGHSGEELVAVLSGAFIDGRTYTAGDFAQNVSGDVHALRATDGAPCVCLIAIHGRLQWRGWARMIRPIIGM